MPSIQERLISTFSSISLSLAILTFRHRSLVTLVVFSVSNNDLLYVAYLIWGRSLYCLILFWSKSKIPERATWLQNNLKHFCLFYYIPYEASVSKQYNASSCQNEKLRFHKTTNTIPNKQCQLINTHISSCIL